LAANVAQGGRVEAGLRAATGGVAKYFKTSRGARFVDSFADGVANEAKSGYTTLTSFVKQQVLKDSELLTSKGVDSVVWHFYKSAQTGKVGASGPLLRLLRENGIQYVIHK
jgi:hypothetical protein